MNTTDKMTNEEILKKTIEKAVKNGWKAPTDKKEIYLGVKEFPHSGLVFVSRPKYNRHITLENAQKGTVVDWKHFIFSHDFAKAFWQQKDYQDRDLEGKYEWAWQSFLAEMVLEEEPIEYLTKFL